MKCKYCFLRFGDQMRVGDFVYVVMVGSSIREFAKFKLIEEYAKDCGLYFRKWDDQVDSHIQRLSAKYKVNGNVIAFPYRSVTVSVSWLYRTILDDSFEAFERNLPLSHNEVVTNLFHHPSFIGYQHHQPCNTSCLSLNVKNLSFEKKVERVKVNLCAAGIVLLVLVDAIISNLMGW